MDEQSVLIREDGKESQQSGHLHVSIEAPTSHDETTEHLEEGHFHSMGSEDFEDRPSVEAQVSVAARVQAWQSRSSFNGARSANRSSWSATTSRAATMIVVEEDEEEEEEKELEEAEQPPEQGTREAAQPQQLNFSIERSEEGLVDNDNSEDQTNSLIAITFTAASSAASTGSSRPMLELAAVHPGIPLFPPTSFSGDGLANPSARPKPGYYDMQHAMQVGQEAFEITDEAWAAAFGVSSYNFRMQAHVSVMERLGMSPGSVKRQQHIPPRGGSTFARGHKRLMKRIGAISASDIYLKTKDSSTKRNFLAITLGLSTFDMPTAIAKCGWLVGILSLVGIALLRIFLVNRLLEVPRLVRQNLASYGELGRGCFGNAGFWITAIFVSFWWYGCCSLYILFTILQFQTQCKDNGRKMLRGCVPWWAWLPCTLALLPLVLRRPGQRELRWASIVSLYAMVTCLIMVSICALFNGFRALGTDKVKVEYDFLPPDSGLLRRQSDLLVDAVSSVSHGLLGVAAVPYVVAEMSSPDQAKKVVGDACKVHTVFTVFVGLAGYFGWGRALLNEKSVLTTGPIDQVRKLDGVQDEGWSDMMAICMQILLVTKTVATYPIYLWPLIREWHGLLNLEDHVAVRLGLPWAFKRAKCRKKLVRYCLIAATLGPVLLLKGGSALEAFQAFSAWVSFVVNFWAPALFSLAAVLYHGWYWRAKQTVSGQLPALQAMNCVEMVDRNRFHSCSDWGVSFDAGVSCQDLSAAEASRRRGSSGTLPVSSERHSSYDSGRSLTSAAKGAFPRSLQPPSPSGSRSPASSTGMARLSAATSPLAPLSEAVATVPAVSPVSGPLRPRAATSAAPASYQQPQHQPPPQLLPQSRSQIDFGRSRVASSSGSSWQVTTTPSPTSPTSRGGVRRCCLGFRRGLLSIKFACQGPLPGPAIQREEGEGEEDSDQRLRRRLKAWSDDDPPLEKDYVGSSYHRQVLVMLVLFVGLSVFLVLHLLRWVEKAKCGLQSYC
mmetsp:Transcript_22237/g.48611  ORF Transcript_22237/g.48611 Transcript_22237/m.48611 type:complete len:1004 (-) Transcript_22237:173-3184(-)